MLLYLVLVLVLALVLVVVLLLFLLLLLLLLLLLCGGWGRLSEILARPAFGLCGFAFVRSELSSLCGCCHPCVHS